MANNNNNDSWRDLYTAAMLELDHGLLQSRIDAAQVAIRRSMEELMGSCAVGAAEERQALSDALGNLQSLQRVEFRKVISPGRQSLGQAEGWCHETHMPQNSNDDLA
jgi:hypothetical protein